MHSLLVLRVAFVSLFSLSVASVPQAGLGNDRSMYRRHSGTITDLDVDLEPRIMQAP